MHRSTGSHCSNRTGDRRCTTRLEPSDRVHWHGVARVQYRVAMRRLVRHNNGHGISIAANIVYQRQYVMRKAASFAGA